MTSPKTVSETFCCSIEALKAGTRSSTFLRNAISVVACAAEESIFANCSTASLARRPAVYRFFLGLVETTVAKPHESSGFDKRREIVRFGFENELEVLVFFILLFVSRFPRRQEV